MQLSSISQKWFYAYGEVSLRGQVPLETDLTFWDAMNACGWTPLANLGRVYLIKPDAEHPLVMEINFREMITTGLTATNVPMRERDIIYVPPTFLGLVAPLSALAGLVYAQRYNATGERRSLSELVAAARPRLPAGRDREGR